MLRLRRKYPTESLWKRVKLVKPKLLRADQKHQTMKYMYE